MPFSSIDFGLPNPNYVVDLNDKQAILPGVLHGARGAAHSLASASIDNITLSATAKVLVASSVGVTIKPITLSGEVILLPLATGDPAVPWWWMAYVHRHLVEREARHEAMAAVGYGYGVLPTPIGAGELEHLPDPDIEVVTAAAAVLLFAA